MGPRLWEFKHEPRRLTPFLIFSYFRFAFQGAPVNKVFLQAFAYIQVLSKCLSIVCHRNQQIKIKMGQTHSGWFKKKKILFYRVSFSSGRICVFSFNPKASNYLGIYPSWRISQFEDRGGSFLGIQRLDRWERLCSQKTPTEEMPPSLWKFRRPMHQIQTPAVWVYWTQISEDWKTQVAPPGSGTLVSGRPKSLFPSSFLIGLIFLLCFSEHIRGSPCPFLSMTLQT